MTHTQAAIEHYHAVLDVLAEALALCRPSAADHEPETRTRRARCQARKQEQLARARDAGLLEA